MTLQFEIGVSLSAVSQLLFTGKHFDKRACVEGDPVGATRGSSPPLNLFGESVSDLVVGQENYHPFIQVELLLRDIVFKRVVCSHKCFIKFQLFYFNVLGRGGLMQILATTTHCPI